MNVITDKRLIRGIWGHTDPEKNCGCPADTKDYVVPGNRNRAFAQSCLLPRTFKKSPQDFPNLDEYREAWREHREAQPAVVRLLDKSLNGYGSMYVFHDKEELARWLTKHRATLIERGEEETDELDSMFAE